MAKRGYKISLRVLKNTRTRQIFLEHEKRKFNLVSPSSHVMFYFHIDTNEIPNNFTLIAFCCERHDLLCSHSNGELFTCEDNMLFSQKRYHVFV